jgi:mono/diheme cytochrome c family protein
MNPAYKRLLIFGMVAAILVIVGEIFAYDVIKIDWNSFMKIQPAFQPMYDPLVVATDSISTEGAVIVPAIGVPENPVKPDKTSLTRGTILFRNSCYICHGEMGKGDGPLAYKILNKPFNLQSFPIHSFSDGGIFYVISTGVPGKMPALNENYTELERWDLVNYVRGLR